MTGFYQSLWDSFELLAESTLLLHNQIKLKADHKTIRKTFEEFCNARQLEYFSDFEKISQIRDNLRYGPPHPEHKDVEKESDRLLKSTNNFLAFVLNFLKERQVAPSLDEFQNKITMNKIKTSKKQKQ